VIALGIEESVCCSLSNSLNPAPAADCVLVLIVQQLTTSPGAYAVLYCLQTFSQAFASAKEHLARSLLK
jgi:hypothetical protein